MHKPRYWSNNADEHMRKNVKTRFVTQSDTSQYTARCIFDTRRGLTHQPAPPNNDTKY